MLKTTVSGILFTMTGLSSFVQICCRPAAAGSPEKKEEGIMARPKQSIIEYRSYELPMDLPVETHHRMNWQISSVKSSRLHIHNCFEIGICLSGRGKMNFGEDEVPFRAGDVLFVARNVPHTTWSDPDEGSTWEYVHMDPETLLGEETVEKTASPQRFYRMLTDCHLMLASEREPWTRSLTENLIAEAEKKEPGCEMVVHGLCEALFFSLFRIYSAEEGTGIYPRLYSGLSPALEYVNRHYMDRFPQEYLADLCHMSPTHFRRIFQKQLGTNPLSYLHQVRMMKSCDLLRSTNLPIADIAEKVGYLSLSCFNRHFTELNGCTPSEWRNLRHETRRTTMIGLAGWDRPETADEIERRNRTDGRESRGGL